MTGGMAISFYIYISVKAANMPIFQYNRCTCSDLYKQFVEGTWFHSHIHLVLEITLALSLQLLYEVFILAIHQTSPNAGVSPVLAREPEGCQYVQTAMAVSDILQPVMTAALDP